MGRWSHLDPDDERLPEGISRVGYDADTESYTFQDRSGAYWESKPGRRYGPLRRVHTSPSVQTVPVIDAIDAPQATRVDEMTEYTRECSIWEEGTEPRPGIEAESKHPDAGSCCERHTPKWEKKHIRNATDGFSRLVGYFRASQAIEHMATRGLCEKTFPDSRRDTGIPAQSRVLHRAVTFDEILARRADVDCCARCGKIKDH